MNFFSIRLFVQLQRLGTSVIFLYDELNERDEEAGGTVFCDSFVGDGRCGPWGRGRGQDWGPDQVHEPIIYLR